MDNTTAQHKALFISATYRRVRVPCPTFQEARSLRARLYAARMRLRRETGDPTLYADVMLSVEGTTLLAEPKITSGARLVRAALEAQP